MEKKQNRIIDFLLSMILPRRMVKRINMPFWVALILIVAACLLNIATPNIHASKDAEKMMNCPDSIKNIPDGLVLTDKDGNEIEGFGVTSYSNQKLNFIVNGESVEKEVTGYGLGAITPNTYFGTYFDDSTGKNVEITLVVDPLAYCGLGSIDSPVVLSNFDLEGYFKKERSDNYDYALYVATFDYYFAVYNMGENNSSTLNSYNYEVDGKEYVYYLPNDETELALNSYGDFDTTLWTKKVSKNDVLSFETSFPGADTIKPVIRHNKNLMHALYSNFYTYSDLNSMVEDGISSLTSVIKANFGQFQKGLFESMILVDTSLIKSSSLIISFLVTVGFIFIISFFTWLISRRMYMTKFKNYLIVCSICFFDISLISLIPGIFFMYSDISFYLLVAAAVYYIVATLLINTMKDKEEDNQQNNNDNSYTSKQPVEYRNLNDGVEHIG